MHTTNPPITMHFVQEYAQNHTTFKLRICFQSSGILYITLSFIEVSTQPSTKVL